LIGRGEKQSYQQVVQLLFIGIQTIVWAEQVIKAYEEYTDSIPYLNADIETIEDLF